RPEGFQSGGGRPDRFQPGASQPGGVWPDESWPPRRPARRRRPRWVVRGAIAAAALAAGTATALLVGGVPAKAPVAAGHSAATKAAPAPKASEPRASGPQGNEPVITVAGAKAVLAGYTSANNTANARMSDGLLAAYETGSSYALDAGSYRQQAALKTGPYPAYGPVQTRFYIPREPAAYPHWFAVQVTNALLVKPGQTRQPANVEYLVFTQAAQGARWLEAAEPYVPRGGATPQVVLDAGGFATAVAAGATGLAVTPGQMAMATAQSLTGPGPVPPPGDLAISAELAYWQRKLPKGTVTHVSQAPADGAVYGLRTQGGGALLFYTDTAELTMTAPPGQVFHLAVPGFYDSGQSLASADLVYLEQFAAYDPPAGTPRIVALYSGITS
ncbi:MAG: hypothetical protein ACRDN0_37595, partial [Trebonia sp.]